jgi:Alpha-kinase family/von Willebrand factor type A domain
MYTSMSFIETEHARLRREQRNIDKKDLKAALRYGTREPSGWHPTRYIYKHDHIVYIVEESHRLKREVTCYAEPLTLEKVPVTLEMEKAHNHAMKMIRKDFNYWTSNTVMVIDTSGSMKKGDMWGTRNRLDSAWVAIALDFLAARLESGVGRETDVVSIIEMGEEANLVFEDVPTTWVLFNEIVDRYNNKDSIPQGHGYYLPSLAVADELLMKNSNAACAPALMFLSDGAPSDQRYLEAPKGQSITLRDKNMIETIESLAKKFGRQLTFTAVGIGSDNEFDLLQRMVDAAKDYGAIAEFVLPSMTSSSLGMAISSVATSITKTQIEMTEIGSTTQRKVREVLRESKSKARKLLTQISEEDFDLYHLSETTRKVYREEHSEDRGKEIFYDEVPLQHADAKYVAFSKGPFGEGAERFAFRFFEIASDGKTVLGLPMVAKESRFILNEVGVENEEARKTFVQTFCGTQQIARRLAMKFNDRLKSNPRVHHDTPRISILDCSIYELDDIYLGKLSVLVESRLDESKWFKWNSNNGMVNGIKVPEAEKNHLTQQYKAAQINAVAVNLVNANLDMIEEQSDDDDSFNSDEDEKNDKADVASIVFTASQVAQAFSHFSFCHTKGKRLVCDLQGVFDEAKNELQFSDPVIHYYSSKHHRRRNVHGRTDRGRNGIDDFFRTHSCAEQNNLCQLVSRGFCPPLRSNDRWKNADSKSSAHHR